jgi:histone deacetylase 1/2
METKRKVSYLYDNEIGSFYYGNDHPMKPFRMKLAHQLIMNYGFCKQMDIYQPHRATHAELQRFHSPDYVEYLNKVMPYTGEVCFNKLEENHFNLGFNDCPVFDGLYDFSQISAGASIGKL